MHAQAATRDAEAQQLQLSTLLQTALEQLGCAPSPSPAVPSRSLSHLSGAPANGGISPASLAGRFRASLEGMRFAQSKEPSVLRSERGPSLDYFQEDPVPAVQESAASVPGIEIENASRRTTGGFSGFSVYTNAIDNDAPHQQAPQASGEERSFVQQGEKLDNLRSSVEWKDMTSAAGASWERQQQLREEHMLAGQEGIASLPHKENSNVTTVTGTQRPAPLVLPNSLLAAAQQGKATTSLIQMGSSLVSPQMALARSQADLMAAMHENPGTSSDPGSLAPTPLPLGTFLSPTLEGMARWKGQHGRPRDHIAAVFRDTEDLEFYAPFSGGFGTISIVLMRLPDVYIAFSSVLH